MKLLPLALILIVGCGKKPEPPAIWGTEATKDFKPQYIVMDGKGAILKCDRIGSSQLSNCRLEPGRSLDEAVWALAMVGYREPLDDRMKNL